MSDLKLTSHYLSGNWFEPFRITMYNLNRNLATYHQDNEIQLASHVSGIHK